jgi:hypothetical protein
MVCHSAFSSDSDSETAFLIVSETPVNYKSNRFEDEECDLFHTYPKIFGEHRTWHRNPVIAKSTWRSIRIQFPPSFDHGAGEGRLGEISDPQSISCPNNGQLPWFESNI